MMTQPMNDDKRVIVICGSRGSSKIPSMIRDLEALNVKYQEHMRANKPDTQKWQGSGKQKMKVIK